MPSLPIRSLLGRSTSLCVLLGAALYATPAQARIDGYPYLDNETIGSFNVIKRAVSGPVDEFDAIYWAPDLLDSFASSGDAMGPLRYVIAFSSYGVAQLAAQTPAYREPYREVMDRLIRKMLHQRSWGDWLDRWGDNPLGPDNIMYTGHLVYMMTLYRQVFGERTYEQDVLLTKISAADDPAFKTNVTSLAASIAEQARTYVDATGKLTYNIACEPGRIFVPCNAPHRVGQLSFDRIYGTDYASSNANWLAWVRQQMVNEEHGVLHDLHFPFGKGQATPGAHSPETEQRLSGVYNGWTIWMLAALDEAWADELYQNYKAYFVVSGAASPYDDGRTVVLDRSGATGIAGTALDTVATGFGLVAARQFLDVELHQELEATWSGTFGEPSWSADGTEYQRSAPVYPLIFQNGFPLLAIATTPDVNLGTLARANWDPAQFAHPVLESVDDPGVFVNQAAYDPALEKLVVTINGGTATSAAVKLSIANLDRGVQHWVRRNGESYTNWQWRGDRMVITTPALSATEESYVVAGPPPLSDNLCASSLVGASEAPTTPWLLATFGGLLLTGFRYRRKGSTLTRARPIPCGHARNVSARRNDFCGR